MVTATTVALQGIEKLLEEEYVYIYIYISLLYLWYLWAQTGLPEPRGEQKDMLKVIALVATAIGVSSYPAKHMTKHIAKHAKPVHSVPPGVCDDWKMGQMWETPAAVQPCSDMIRSVTG